MIRKRLPYRSREFSPGPSSGTSAQGLLGELAVAREAGVPEDLGVAQDSLAEDVPGAVELPGEEALGERPGVWRGSETGVEVQLFEAPDHVGHQAVGGVYVFERLLGGLEGVLGELHTVVAAPLLQQSFEHVDRLPDAADVSPDLAVGTKSRYAKAWSISARIDATSAAVPSAGCAARSNSRRASASSSWA